MELTFFLSMVSGIILLGKLKWKDKVIKKIHAVFWSTVLVFAFLSHILIFDIISTYPSLLIIILNILLLSSVIVLSFKINYNELNLFYKVIAIILYVSTLSFIIILGLSYI